MMDWSQVVYIIVIAILFILFINEMTKRNQQSSIRDYRSSITMGLLRLRSLDYDRYQTIARAYDLLEKSKSGDAAADSKRYEYISEMIDSEIKSAEARQCR